MSDFLFIAVMVLCVIGVAFASFMLVRNAWLWRERLKLIERFYAIPTDRRWELTAKGEGWDSDYLTRDQMMWRFWVWDIEKLRKPGGDT